MLLTLLAIDKLTEKNEEPDKSESLLFPGIVLSLIVIGLLYAILNKLGVPSEYLQWALVIIVAPFIWDYLISFSGVMEFSNIHYILAAVATMIVSVLVLWLLQWFLDIYRLCANSKYPFVKGIVPLLTLLTIILRAFVFAVFFVGMFKFGIHSVIGFFTWLF